MDKSRNDSFLESVPLDSFPYPHSEISTALDKLKDITLRGLKYHVPDIESVLWSSYFVSHFTFSSSEDGNIDPNARPKLQGPLFVVKRANQEYYFVHLAHNSSGYRLNKISKEMELNKTGNNFLYFKNPGDRKSIHCLVFQETHSNDRDELIDLLTKIASMEEDAEKDTNNGASTPQQSNSPILDLIGTPVPTNSKKPTKPRIDLSSVANSSKDSTFADILLQKIFEMDLSLNTKKEIMKDAISTSLKYLADDEEFIDRIVSKIMEDSVIF